MCPGRWASLCALQRSAALTDQSARALEQVELCCPALTDCCGITSLAAAATGEPPKALPPVASLLRTRFK